MTEVVKEEVKRKCIVCEKNVVDWESVKEEFEDYFVQADAFGVQSLTEAQQTVLEGKVCSYECYDGLE